MKAHLLILVVILGSFAKVSPASACSCLPPDRARSYESADNVVHVRIQALVARTATTRAYLARLAEDDFKGCLDAGRRVFIETPSSSAACGMNLSVGEEYLLYGDRAGSLLDLPRLRVHSCGANSVYSGLTPDHLAFLTSRYVCCGGSCACTDGSQPVNCFVDPCQVSSCDVDGAECRANYCGGCNAEWYDPTGALVCKAPSKCDYNAPDRDYVAESPEKCATVRFACPAGSAAFFDECGCGCTVPPLNDCHVGGCSGQLCVGPGEPDITTCEWRPEYACYRTATCERQSSGACGWTKTPALQACLDGSR